ncbi:MAG: M13 family metallopeptidase [Acidobacteriaceae bacterium]
MRNVTLCSLLLLSVGVCGAQSFAPADRDSGPSTIPKKPAIFDVSAIDKTADPCTDFFQYACGNWNAKNPIPSDQVRWGRFNELADYNNYLLYSDLKAAADAPKSPLQKKYGDYFGACMNTELVDKLGAKPLQPQLDAIAALTSTKDLAAFNAKQERRGGGALFGVGVTQDQKDSSQQIAATGQGGLGLPDRDYYLNQEDRYKTIREQYVAHVTAMFVLLGDTPEKAAKEAASVMRIETELAEGSMDRVEMRDPSKRYHIMTIAELEKLTPNYNWQAYLDGIDLPAKTINVSSVKFAKAANEVLGTEDLSALKSYMRWHLVHSSAPLLSKPFETENFAFYNQTLQGQKEQQPRWKRCTRLTDGALGEAVGQDWVRQNFPGDSKANMEKLVHALETAMQEDLKTLPWMSAETKVEARKKLDAITDKIGYPAKWRDYSTIEVKRDDLLGNVTRSGNFERKRNLAKFGKPVDPTEWGMTPPTVNAYYNPAQNNINFPAGILQPPFYSNTMDPAVNFGAIGVVIGHEMTHGFDDQGSQYGPTGNVKYNADGSIGSWFTPEDKAKFKERSECTASEYDKFQVAPGQNLNGHLTLGENSADNAGIRIAYIALMDTLAKEGAKAEPGYVKGERDGYTPQQRFFISFGQVWCQNQTEQSARVLAKTDPHSTGEWRVKGTVQNFDEFGKAFGCKVGQPMMPASGGCRTW